MPGNGTITTEHTVWCCICDVWFQWSESYMSWFIKIIREDGWRKIKGKWVCPDCLNKESNGEEKANASP